MRFSPRLAYLTIVAVFAVANAAHAQLRDTPDPCAGLTAGRQGTLKFAWQPAWARVEDIKHELFVTCDSPWNECVREWLGDTVSGNSNRRALGEIEQQVRELLNRVTGGYRPDSGCPPTGDLNPENIHELVFWCTNTKKDCANELDRAIRMLQAADPLDRCIQSYDLTKRQAEADEQVRNQCRERERARREAQAQQEAAAKAQAERVAEQQRAQQEQLAAKRKQAEENLARSREINERKKAEAAARLEQFRQQAHERRRAKLAAIQERQRTIQSTVNAVGKTVTDALHQIAAAEAAREQQQEIEREQERLEREQREAEEEVQREIEEEEARLNRERLEALPRSELHVVTQPPGAEIFLDGNIERCSSPCTITELLAEDHNVEVRLHGHRSQSHHVFLEAGGAGELTVALKQYGPRFRVESQCVRAPAKVYLDGKPIAATNEDGELAFTAQPGRHTVRLAARNCGSRVQEVDLHAGQEPGEWPVLQGDLDPSFVGLLRTWQGPATAKKRWAISAGLELTTFSRGTLPGFVVTPVNVGTDYFRFMVDGGYSQGTISGSTVSSARVGTRMAVRIPLTYVALLIGNGVGYRALFGDGFSNRNAFELPLWAGIEADPICGLSIEVTGGYVFSPFPVTATSAGFDSATFVVAAGYSPNKKCVQLKKQSPVAAGFIPSAVIR